MDLLSGGMLICKTANERIAFQISSNSNPSIGYQEIKCHMIFDVKLGAKLQ
jgi:hypothetical protein